MLHSYSETALPTLVQRLAHDFAQKLLTTASVALASHGVLTQTQSTQFVEVGTALALYAAGSLWTVVAGVIRAQREKKLLATVPSVVGAGR